MNNRRAPADNLSRGILCAYAKSTVNKHTTGVIITRSRFAALSHDALELSFCMHELTHVLRQKPPLGGLSPECGRQQERSSHLKFSFLEPLSGGRHVGVPAQLLCTRIQRMFSCGLLRTSSLLICCPFFGLFALPVHCGIGGRLPQKHNRSQVH